MLSLVSGSGGVDVHIYGQSPKVDNSKKTAQRKNTEISVMRVFKKIIGKFIDICINNDIIIFGSFVREHISERKFNPNFSDIEIFHKDIHQNAFIDLFTSHGFLIEANTDPHNYYNSKRFIVSMVNDEFFIGKKISFNVFLVSNDQHSFPLFNNLDFTCNAWIWDKHGIRLSRQTGTEIDKLSSRHIKYYEINLIDECNKKIATYIPTKKPGEIIQMNYSSILQRKSRIYHIIKLIRNGWILRGINIQQIRPKNGNEICTICQENIIEPCVKMSCCASTCHYDCFISYSESRLSVKSYVECFLRCSELHI